MHTEKQINLKEHMDTKMENIRVNETMKQNIMAQIESEQNHETIRKSSGKWNRKKLILMAAAAVLIAAYPVTVGAQAAYRAVSEWVTSSVNGVLAENLYAIDGAATDQGIRVEVESAVNDGHSALVFITVQDVEGKNRLAEDIDLCDSFDLNIDGVRGHAIAMAELESYDPETQTARFASHTTIHGDIADKSATLTLGGIMAHKTEYPNLDTGVNLAALAQPNPTRGGRDIKTIYGMGYIGEEPSQPKKKDLLTPDVMDIPLDNGLDFVHITNVGFLDGRLHLQTRWEQSFDNHGFFELCRKDYTGDLSSEDRTAYLAPQSGVTDIDFDTVNDSRTESFYYHTKHIEYIFDVTPEELKDYNLIAVGFVEDGDLIRGSWNIRFRTQHTDTLTFDGGSHASRVEITPLGVYVEGYTGKDMPSVDIHYADGSSETVDGFGLRSISGIFRRRQSCYAETPREKTLDEITLVTIDGEEIEPRS
ncbi:MAG: hypothetical protein II828_08865 [Clostridia bacterium]|nr:hypothetical protein [Clostridia bacterium]